METQGGSSAGMLIFKNFEMLLSNDRISVEVFEQFLRSDTEYKLEF